MGGTVPVDEYRQAYRNIKGSEERRGFLYHLVVFVLGNALLVAIDLTYFPSSTWFYYPLAGWGIGVGTHYVFGVRNVEQRVKDRESKAVRKAREMN